MKDYLMLLKWQFKINFSFRRLKGEKITKSPMFAAIIVGLCFLPMVVLVCAFIVSLTPSIFAIGIPIQFVTALIGIVQSIIFVFGLMSMMSKMFFSKDNEFLASLPVKSSAVFMSKFTIVYISELALCAFILLPTLLSFAIAGSLSGCAINWVFYLMIPFMIVFAPALPLFLVAIFSLPTMYIISFFKKRSMFAGLAGIVLFILVMGGYMLITMSAKGVGNVEDVLVQLIYVFNTMTKVFIFNMFIVKASLGINIFVSLLIHIGIFVGFIAVALLLSSFFYRKGLVLMLETSVNKKKKSSDKAEKLSKIKSPIVAIMIRDLKLVLREPSLAFNSLMGPLFTPVFIFILGPSMTRGFGAGGLGIDAEITAFTMIFFYTSMLLSGMNYFANIAFSREGDKFYINKYLPIDLKVIVKGKLYLAIMVSMIGVAISTIASVVSFKLTALPAIALAVMMTLFTVAFSLFGMYLDMRNPKLHWTHIQEITKRNSTAILPMFLGMGVGLGSLLLNIVLSAAKVNILFRWIILLGVIGVVGITLLIVMLSKFKNVSNDFLENIEC